MAKLISKTYGEALFEIAMEGQKTDLFLQEAQDILTILDQNPELDKLMKHPKVSVTPHIGGSTKEAQGRIGLEIVDIIRGF